MKWHHYSWWRILLANLALMASTCLAGTDSTSSYLPFDSFDWKLPDSVQIHGFASQSYLHTSDNNFFGHTTNMGSLDFTEMGINGSWRPVPQLQTSMQVVYRRAGRTDDQDLRIDFGFVDYAAVSDAEHLWGIRAGRVVNPYGLYNDTRDMPFTRPSILLPQSIYFDIDRNLALSSDGIQLYGEHRTDFGDFQLQFNSGFSRASDPFWKPFLDSKIVNGELSWIGRLMYEWEGGKVRLGVSSGELNIGYKPRSLPPHTRSSSLSAAPILFSAQYNEEDWSLTSEYAIRQSTFQNFGSPDLNFIGESYYVQGTYRFTTEVEGFVRYDVYYANRADRNGQKAAASTGGAAYDNYAKDLAVGFRWDVTPSIMLRTEYHYINGTGWTSPEENTGATSKYWNLFALSVSFRF